ncbi:MAG: hypothetical protein ACOX85_12000 [Candidatus Pararuminococcus gallinarum]|jgi:hypothetical protein
MKKSNKLMRASGILLVLTLITSCFVGGTFAKYVSEGEGNDSARVAKWGVVVTGKGDAFLREYTTDDETVKDSIGISVKSDVAVIAPGTSGEFKGITLSGTPEVAINIATTAMVDLTGDWTLDADGKFYCPIIFNVNGVRVSGLEYDSAEAFETALKNKIEAAANGNVQAGVDLANPQSTDGVPILFQKNDDETSKIKWEWAFEDGHDQLRVVKIQQSDARDTELGNNAANGDAPTISLKLETTVTQID